MMGILAWALLALLHLADGVLTWSLLKRRGKREANPVMAGLIARFGVGGALIAFKTPMVLAVGWAIAHHWPFIIPVTLGLDAIMVGVVGWNIRQSRK